MFWTIVGALSFFFVGLPLIVNFLLWIGQEFYKDTPWAHGIKTHKPAKIRLKDGLIWTAKLYGFIFLFIIILCLLGYISSFLW